MNGSELAPVGPWADQSGFQPKLEATAFRRWSIHIDSLTIIEMELGCRSHPDRDFRNLSVVSAQKDD
jgi:hypothetical protein